MYLMRQSNFKDWHLLVLGLAQLALHVQLLVKENVHQGAEDVEEE